jgi:hypothetical protein
MSGALLEDGRASGKTPGRITGATEGSNEGGCISPSREMAKRHGESGGKLRAVCATTAARKIGVYFLASGNAVLVFLVNDEGLWIVSHHRNRPLPMCTTEDAEKAEPYSQ